MATKQQISANINLSNTLELLSKLLINNKSMLVTAESCTGGLISACCTEIAGSSRWFERGYVTYSNQSKTEMLAVPADLIEKHGAVSSQVVAAMAKGAFEKSSAQSPIAISVSGIAGPDGGTPDKPVGTIYVGIHSKEHQSWERLQLSGERVTIRQSVVLDALKRVIKVLETNQ